MGLSIWPPGVLNTMLGRSTMYEGILWPAKYLSLYYSRCMMWNSNAIQRRTRTDKKLRNSIREIIAIVPRQIVGGCIETIVNRLKECPQLSRRFWSLSKLQYPDWWHLVLSGKYSCWWRLNPTAEEVFDSVDLNTGVPYTIDSLSENLLTHCGGHPSWKVIN